MSFWDYVFDSEFSQRSDINNLNNISKSLREQRRRDRRESRRQKEKLSEKVDELELEVARMTLFSRSLLKILSDKNICTPAEWEATLRTLDLEDGKIDGR